MTRKTMVLGIIAGAAIWFLGLICAQRFGWGGGILLLFLGSVSTGVFAALLIAYEMEAAYRRKIRYLKWRIEQIQKMIDREVENMKEGEVNRDEKNS